MKKTKPSKPNFPKSICEAPLVIGDNEIPCAVLDTDVRVFSRRKLFSIMKLSSGGGKNNEVNLPRFLQASNLTPYISKELMSMGFIEYSPKSGRTAYGIKAEFLPMMCEVFINAAADGVLKKHQQPIATICRILQNGFAKVGIIALIDEATGYQDIRARDSLAKILNLYLSKEIHKWTKTFPIDFYREIYRLKGWEWKELKNGKKPPTPWIVGRYTDDWVYKRIAPGVREELREKNSNRKVKHHQLFNLEEGYPRLRDHIAGVTAIMKVSDSLEECKRNINKAFPLKWKKGDLFYMKKDTK